ncbi:MAG: hypothetical protein ABI541_06405 [Betaproteobacteria bacterium]
MNLAWRLFVPACHAGTHAVRTQRMVYFGRGILKCGNRPSHRSSLKHVRNFPGHRLLENVADGIGRIHRHGITQDDTRASLGVGRKLLPIIGLVRHRYLTPVLLGQTLFQPLEVVPRPQPRLCGIAHQAEKYVALKVTCVYAWVAGSSSK